MLLVVTHIHDAMNCKAPLPYLMGHPQLLPKLIGISSFDELHGPFKRASLARSNEQMKMVRHEDKFMERILALVPIKRENLDE